MNRRPPPRTEGFTFKLGIPGWAAFEWRVAPTDTDRHLAAAVYGQFGTSLLVRAMSEQASSGEALTKVYDLGRYIKSCLDADPSVLRRRKDGETSTGALLGRVLNGLIIPFLEAWHVPHAMWMERRRDGLGTFTHERQWSEKSEFWNDLAKLREQLVPFMLDLARIGECENIIPGLDTNGKPIDWPVPGRRTSPPR